MRSTDSYSGHLAQYTKKAMSMAKRARFLSTGRLISFAIPVLSLVFLYKKDSDLSMIIASIGLVFFIVLIVMYERLQKRLKLMQTMVMVCQQEIDALNGNDSAFGSGSKREEPDHDFSADLDLFGKASLFQHLNRCTSVAGERKLADWLMHPLSSPDQIDKRFNAIDELAPLVDWRMQYRAIGLLQKAGDSVAGKLMDWVKSPSHYTKKSIYYLIRIIAPAVSVILIVLMIAGIGIGNALIIWVLALLAFTGSQLKKTNAVHEKLGRQSGELKQFAGNLQLITSQKFSSVTLSELHSALGAEKGGAEYAIGKLAGISARFDSRLNMLGGIILNGLFLWDLQCVMQLEKWQLRYGDELFVWMEKLAEMQALLSMSVLRYHHPDFCRPVCRSAGDFTFSANELGHPLLASSKRICNDINLQGFGQFMVITGANMAGKSTFLRTVGINLVLAQCGLPVCAKSMEFNPISLFSSMRTTDSLQDGESYFFAELKRLSHLISRLKKGERMFVLLDEMLKGTNSRDKQQGSMALTSNLVQLGATGLLATHDLALGELADQFPGRVHNQCFEVFTKGDQMSFDYKLREGICQNLNATFLMRKMGLMPPQMNKPGS